MIIGCPACRRSYRLDDARFRADARMRCTRCGHLFAPEQRPASPPGEPVHEAPATVALPRSSDPSPTPGRLAVLADAGRAFRHRALPLLQTMGCRVITVEDGTEAFRAAVAGKPALMMVSVHLAGLSGVAICEGVKGSPHLWAIKVALVGSELTADLFNRDTALAYGADLFLDERMSEDELRAELGPHLAAAGAEEREEHDFDDSIAALTREDGPPGTAAEEIARLARIMLSDLRLYYPDRFAAALGEGRLLEAFEDELARGRDLIDHRFPGVPARQTLLAAALREGVAGETRTDSSISSSGRRTGSR